MNLTEQDVLALVKLNARLMQSVTQLEQRVTELARELAEAKTEAAGDE